MENSVPRMRVVLVIIIGILAISSASVLIRICQNPELRQPTVSGALPAPPDASNQVPSMVIATYRLVIASLFYLILSWSKKVPIWSAFSSAQRWLALISGAFLTIHFATWITSLKYTSIASSVVLVQSAPIFVALGSIFLLKERFSWKIFIGIAITIVGGIIISLNDFSTNQNSFIGNILAVLGALGAAGYMLAGRKLRSEMSTLQYVTPVYSIAAILLFILTLIQGKALFGYQVITYLLLAAIALVPQAIGHTSFNWALKYFSATTVSVLILGEPIGASILGFLVLNERVGLMTMIGGIVILIGVTVVILISDKERV